MEIKLKLGELLTLNQTLKIIIDDTETKLEALFKFKLLGIMKTIEPYVANFETIRNEKIAEYGDVSEDGTTAISIDNKDAVEKFNKDLLEVINSKVTINIDKLKATDVFDKGLKTEYLMCLYPLIEE